MAYYYVHVHGSSWYSRPITMFMFIAPYNARSLLLHVYIYGSLLGSLPNIEGS